MQYEFTGTKLGMEVAPWLQSGIGAVVDGLLNEELPHALLHKRIDQIADMDTTELHFVEILELLRNVPRPVTIQFSRAEEFKAESSPSQVRFCIDDRCAYSITMQNTLMLDGAPGRYKEGIRMNSEEALIW